MVDVHIGIVSSDGTIYEYPDGNTILRPWLKDIALSETFKFPGAPIVTLPPLPVGTWRAFAAFTEPGTTDIVSLDLAPFKILPESVPELDGDPIYGLLALTRGQSPSGTNVDALGVFVQSANVETVLSAFGRGADGVGVDECAFNQAGSLLTQAGSFNTLDAGASLSVKPSGGSAITVPQDFLLLFPYYTAAAAPSFYQGGKNYTFSGKGDGFKAITGFSTSVTAPQPLTIVQPPLSDSLTHNANLNLPLSWNGNNGVGVVEVLVAGGDAVSIGTIGCRFWDDGSAAIPSNLLKQLRDNFPDADFTLSVNRFKYSLFDTTRNDLDLGVAAITAGVSMPIDLN
ncbi:MAG: hypothetical protein WBG92_15275 [Thiohalocapsa sp.]